MIIVPRAGWKARPARSKSNAVRSGRWKVHWTVTCSEPSIEQEKRSVQEIQNFHMDGRGWSDIAYNYLIGPSGRVYEGRGHGVRSAANGNSYLNYQHHAIAVIAGPRCKATPEALSALGDFLEVYATDEVKGHRDGYSTSCPGDQIYKFIQDEDWKVGLVNRGPSYFTWRAWKCSRGPWQGLGQKEKGARYRPKIPRKTSPKWPRWWLKFALSGACKEKKK